MKVGELEKAVASELASERQNFIYNLVEPFNGHFCLDVLSNVADGSIVGCVFMGSEYRTNDSCIDPTFTRFLTSEESLNVIAAYRDSAGTYLWHELKHKNAETRRRRDRIWLDTASFKSTFCNLYKLRHL